MESITQAEKVLYTGRTHTTGGRNRGVAESPDGRLVVQLSEPNTGGTGTNPEQLFAAAWSACYESAMETAARRLHAALPDDTALDAEIDLCLLNGVYSLRARLRVSLPGMDRSIAERIIEDAHLICPYSKAIRGNVAVMTSLA